MKETECTRRLSKEVQDMWLDYEYTVLSGISDDAGKEVVITTIRKLIKEENELNAKIKESLSEAQNIFREYSVRTRQQKTQKLIDLTIKRYIKDLNP